MLKCCKKDLLKVAVLPEKRTIIAKSETYPSCNLETILPTGWTNESWNGLALVLKEDTQRPKHSPGKEWRNPKFISQWSKPPSGWAALRLSRWGSSGWSAPIRTQYRQEHSAAPDDEGIVGPGMGMTQEGRMPAGPMMKKPVRDGWHSLLGCSWRVADIGELQATTTPKSNDTCRPFWGIPAWT